MFSEISILCGGCDATVHITAASLALHDTAERTQVHCPACQTLVGHTSDTVLTVSIANRVV